MPRESKLSLRKIKNSELDQYGTEPLKQQQFVPAGVEGVNKLITTLDPRYNMLQYNADSVITLLRSWTATFQGLAKAA